MYGTLKRSFIRPWYDFLLLSIICYVIIIIWDQLIVFGVSIVKIFYQFFIILVLNVNIKFSHYVMAFNWETLMLVMLFDYNLNLSFIKILYHVRLQLIWLRWHTILYIKNMLRSTCHFMFSVNIIWCSGSWIVLRKPWYPFILVVLPG